jgi:Zn-dependent peptidase ImmA (M78 family)
MEDAKRTAVELMEKYHTNDPFEIAEQQGVYTQVGPLGKIFGCCLTIAGERFIYINSDLDTPTQKMVAAHELGHAVMHREDYFFFNWIPDTLYRNRAEIEAHTFAVELLVPDSVVLEHPGFTLNQLSALTGYAENFLKFKKI